MWRSVAVVALVLLMPACSAGSQGPTELHPSYTSPPCTEPQVETTTTATMSTTTVASITTTVAPWTTLAEPVCPSAVLAAELGGPAPIEAMCLEVTTGGQIESAEEATAGLADVLDLLGIRVVPEGCQATFRLSVTGSRISDFYRIGETTTRCGTGLILSGQSSLDVDGVTERVWTVDINTPPPATTETCPDESAGLMRHAWDDELVAAPLTEMFGEVAGYAEWIGFEEAHIGVDSRPPPAGDELEWLTCWLVEQKPTAVSRLGYMAQVDANQPALLPVAPYLIALLDSAQQCAWCSSPSDIEAADSIGVRLHSALCSILSVNIDTGISHNGAPAQRWWGVWEQQQGS